jgi:hypothetical protein
MKGNRNRGNHQKKNTASGYFGTPEYQDKVDAAKYANQLRSQKLYGWADNWERYSKSPAGTPKPPNYHNNPSSFSAGSTDPRMQMYPHTIFTQYGGDVDEYNRVMNRVPTSAHLGGGGCGHSTIFNQEKSNAELGQVLDAKGHPSQLIKKLNDLRKKYPAIYGHPKGHAVV